MCPFPPTLKELLKKQKELEMREKGKILQTLSLQNARLAYRNSASKKGVNFSG